MTSRISYAIVTAALVAAAAFSATAAPITYTLMNVSASAFAPSGVGPLNLTGTFTFDPSTVTLDAVDITATGPTTTNPPVLLASPEVFTIPEVVTTIIPGLFLTGSQVIAFRAPTTNDLLEISFTSPLTNATDSISIITDFSPMQVIEEMINPFCANGAACDNAIGTGDAVPVPVPVPTLPPGPAVLILALGLFFLTRRANRADRPN